VILRAHCLDHFADPQRVAQVTAMQVKLSGQMCDAPVVAMHDAMHFEVRLLHQQFG
jgi:hypothetical protein